MLVSASKPASVVSARFEMICVDDGLDTDNLRMITAGMNWYIKGHSAKLTGDIVYCLDEVNAINTMGVGLSGIGILTDSEGEDGQFVVRLQFQLLF